MIRIRRSTTLGAVLLLTMVVGCSGTRASRPYVSREISEGRARNVKLISVADAQGNLETFDHPVSFTVEDMPTLLSQFTVSRKGNRGWLEPQPLFEDSEIRGVARSLAQAFQEATKTEYVAFKFSHRVESIIFDKYEVTAGTMFVRDNEFHLRLEYFRLPPEEVGVISYGAGGVEARRHLRMETGPTMRYVPDPDTGTVYKDWIAMDWDALETKLTARRQDRARRAAARQRAAQDRSRGKQEPGGEGWETLQDGVPPREDVFFPDEVSP